MATQGGTVSKLGLALAFGFGLAGAPLHASAQGAETSAGTPEAARPDPWEGLNRGLYAINQGIDTVILSPVAHAYMAVVPRPMRGGVHNILLNLEEPTTFVNRVLQIEPTLAGRTVLRFVVNSTLGIGGAWDIADRGGLPRQPTDFGETLAKMGSGPGPYLFVPIMGPSTVRDSFGDLVDIVTSPLNLTQINKYPPNIYARVGLTIADRRSLADPLLHDVRRTATDPYATLRSLYLQNRQSTVTGGELNVQDLPDFGPAPEAAPATPPAPAPAPAPSGHISQAIPEPTPLAPPPAMARYYPEPQAAPAPVQATQVAPAVPGKPAWQAAVLADRDYELNARRRF